MNGAVDKPEITECWSQNSWQSNFKSGGFPVCLGSDRFMAVFLVSLMTCV